MKKKSRKGHAKARAQAPDSPYVQRMIEAVFGSPKSKPVKTTPEPMTIHDAISTTFDLGVAAAHDPEALREVEPVRAELDQIRRCVEQIGPVSEQQLHAAEEAQDHRLYTAFAHNLGSISITMEFDATEQFFLPIMGGKPFFSHVLRCRYCLLSLARIHINLPDGLKDAATVEEVVRVIPDFLRLIADPKKTQ